jgi:hypothetical protein
MFKRDEITLVLALCLAVLAVLLTAPGSIEEAWGKVTYIAAALNTPPTQWKHKPLVVIPGIGD